MPDNQSFTEVKSWEVEDANAFFGREIGFEQIAGAKTLCSLRGTDPFDSITIGHPDGSMEDFAPAWLGYIAMLETAEEAERGATLTVEDRPGA